MSLAKFNYVRSKAIRNSANGASCSMRSPVCNGDSSTTVWAHSNQGIHGKGKGVKSSDVFGAYLCSSCHDWYDGRRGNHTDPNWLMRSEYFERAMAESLIRLITKGIITCKP